MAVWQWKQSINELHHCPHTCSPAQLIYGASIIWLEGSLPAFRLWAGSQEPQDKSKQLPNCVCCVAMHTRCNSRSRKPWDLTIQSLCILIAEVKTTCIFKVQIFVALGPASDEVITYTWVTWGHIPPSFQHPPTPEQLLSTSFLPALGLLVLKPTSRLHWPFMNPISEWFHQLISCPLDQHF